jgi:hypothetical protein
VFTRPERDEPSLAVCQEAGGPNAAGLRRRPCGCRRHAPAARPRAARAPPSAAGAPAQDRAPPPSPGNASAPFAPTPPKPQTYCFGLAASMGAFLLGAGRKGKRHSYPNSRIMIHQPLGGASGQARRAALRCSAGPLLCPSCALRRGVPRAAAAHPSVPAQLQPTGPRPSPPLPKPRPREPRAASLHPAAPLRPNPRPPRTRPKPTPHP